MLSITFELFHAFTYIHWLPNVIQTRIEPMNSDNRDVGTVRAGTEVQVDKSTIVS